ncbi:MAG: hypothetical protein ACR2JC_09045 [Chloroflexota bacterium]
MHVTAYARHTGDDATWQVCLLRRGMSVSFSANPTTASSDAHGVVAERNILTLHVAPSVRPGVYHLVFLSYSYIDGLRSPPHVEGFHPDLRVRANHAATLPPFHTWHWIPSLSPQDIVPSSSCSSMPSVAPGP